jgi:hypothetical protein
VTLALLAGCSPEGTSVLARVTAPAGVTIHSLDVTVTVGTTIKPRFHYDDPRLPSRLLISLADADAPVRIDLAATSSDGRALATSGSTQARAHQQVTMSLVLELGNAGGDLAPGSDMGVVDLSGADLSGADLSGTNLPPSDLSPPPPPPACNKTTLVADNFASSAIGPLWGGSYFDSGITSSQSGGELVIGLSGSNNRFAAYRTGDWYDQAESKVSAEITQVPKQDGNVSTFLNALVTDQVDQLQFEIIGGQLNMRRIVGGSSAGPDTVTVTYNTTNHRFLQLRETGGNSYWETSPDGVNWTVQMTRPTPSWIHFVMIEIGAGTVAATTGPGALHVKQINGGTPSGIRCPISVLQDPFSSAQISPQWGNSFPDPPSSNCTRANVGGNAVLTPAPSIATQCGYVSGPGYDLTNGAVAVQVPQVVNSATGVSSWMEVRADFMNRLAMSYENGTLSFNKMIGGLTSTIASTTYNPGVPQWWRFREANGSVFWETSPDGRTWATWLSAVDPIPLGAVNFAIGVTASGASNNPGSGRFDNVNLTP